MRNVKSYKTNDRARMRKIRKEITNAIIPMAAGDLAELLEIPVKTLEDYMFRHDLRIGKEESQRRAMVVDRMIYYLNCNGFDYKDLAKLFDRDETCLATELTVIKLKIEEEEKNGKENS